MHIVDYQQFMFFAKFLWLFVKQMGDGRGFKGHV